MALEKIELNNFYKIKHVKKCFHPFSFGDLIVL